jgi:hypothetical protein
VDTDTEVKFIINLLFMPKKILLITINLIINSPLVNGVYSKYQLVAELKTWDDAQTHCVGLGGELAQITSEADRILITAQVSQVERITTVGVRCKTPDVADDWSYTGSSYVISTGINKNVNWCSGKPSSSCGNK